MYLWCVFIIVEFGITQAWHYNATSLAAGNAIVVNRCNQDVYLQNTPSAGGGYTNVNRILAPGGRYEQHFTPLTNGNGWSIKLAKDASLDDVLQYEYTWHPVLTPKTIWFDLSQVNGNPWENNYWISASGPGCNPVQHAYLYSTDDSYGMQTCPSDADIVVTLCYSEPNTGDGVIEAGSLNGSLEMSSGLDQTAEPNIVPSTLLPVPSTTAAPSSGPSLSAFHGGETPSSEKAADKLVLTAYHDPQQTKTTGTTLTTIKAQMSSEASMDTAIVLEKVVLEDFAVSSPQWR